VAVEVFGAHLKEDLTAPTITSSICSVATYTHAVGSDSILDSLILDSIDKALGDLLSVRVREAIYDSLERMKLLARTEIPQHLDVFFGLLEETFGKGSRTIGKAVAKRLYSRLGWEFTETPGFEFPDYLQMARRRLCGKFDATYLR
jgi:hypothetical protein